MRTGSVRREEGRWVPEGPAGFLAMLRGLARAPQGRSAARLQTQSPREHGLSKKLKRGPKCADRREGSYLEGGGDTGHQGEGHRPSDGDKAQRIGALDKAKGLPAAVPRGNELGRAEDAGRWWGLGCAGWSLSSWRTRCGARGAAHHVWETCCVCSVPRPRRSASQHWEAVHAVLPCLLLQQEPDSGPTRRVSWGHREEDAGPCRTLK